MCVHVDALQIEAENKGSETMKTTHALHAYYRVSDIGATRIEGLSKVPFHDNTDERKKKDGAADRLDIDGETDRIYTGIGV